MVPITNRCPRVAVTRLINFYDAATGRVRFHATRADMIRAQAIAAGIELRAIDTSRPAMEGRLCEELATLRRDGFAGVVLGDIHLAEVRAWYEERSDPKDSNTKSRSGASRPPTW